MGLKSKKEKTDKPKDKAPFFTKEKVLKTLKLIVSKTLSFFKIVATDIVAFLRWIYNHIIKIHKDANKRNKKKFKYTSSLLLVGAIGFLLLGLTVFILELGIFSNKNKSYIIPPEEEEIKFISIKDGYITEKLIVEAGELLPNIREYFSDGYNLSDDATITYLINDTAIPVESFTYLNDKLLYVRGSNIEISVLITNNGESYESVLDIRDVTAPTIQLEPATIVAGDSINPISFVAIFIDNSHSFEFTAELLTDGDFKKEGTYEVEVKVCDAANNCSQGKTTLTVTKKEETPPSGSGGGSQGGGSSNPGGSQGGGNQGGGTTQQPPIKDENTSSESNNNPAPPGGGGGSSNPGSGTGSNNGNSTLNAAVARQAVGEYELRNDYLSINYYGATKKTYYAYAKYILYSDGFVEILESSGAGATIWDYSTFNTNSSNLSLMKRDAISYLMTNTTSHENVTSTFLTRTNELRRANGLPEYVMDYDLCILATMRIYEMVYGNKLDHIRPNGKNFDTLIQEYGYQPGIFNGNKMAYGENLAAGQSSNVKAFEELKASSGHYKNMVDSRFSRMGVATFYDKESKRRIWVQLFTS